ncbi:MAG: hypothetical protein CO013_05525, partial [Syntrophobacterales bacterium CG_4_8_14_3_um_filter_58_8]
MRGTRAREDTARSSSTGRDGENSRRDSAGQPTIAWNSWPASRRWIPWRPRQTSFCTAIRGTWSTGSARAGPANGAPTAGCA